MSVVVAERHAGVPPAPTPQTWVELAPAPLASGARSELYQPAQAPEQAPDSLPEAPSAAMERPEQWPAFRSEAWKAARETEPPAESVAEQANRPGLIYSDSPLLLPLLLQPPP